MNKIEIYKDPVSGEIQMVCAPIDPTTEQGLVRDIVIREMALYGAAMPRLVLKKPKKNFHTGTRNGVPAKRRK